MRAPVVANQVDAGVGSLTRSRNPCTDVQRRGTVRRQVLRRDVEARSPWRRATSSVGRFGGGHADPEVSASATIEWIVTGWNGSPSAKRRERGNGPHR